LLISGSDEIDDSLRRSISPNSSGTKIYDVINAPNPM
jgi:hypothetical protein